MAKFKKSLKRMLKNEGGFFYSQYDSGSRTRFGITEKVACANGFRGNMRFLPKSLAMKIYKINYWPSYLSRVPQNIADSVFDMCVNAGKSKGIKCFQKALNLMNTVLLLNDKQRMLFLDLKIDGDFGLKTLSAFQKINKRDYKILLACIKGFRFVHYKDCCKKKKTQKGFIRSWIRRLI